MDPELQELIRQRLGAQGTQGTRKQVDPSRMTTSEMRSESFNNLATDDPARYKQDEKYSEKMKLERGDPAMDREMLSLIDDVIGSASKDGNIPGSGVITNLFMAPNATERGPVGNLSNAIMSVSSQKANEVQSKITRILAKQFQEAYKTLKGGGQITEYEGKTVAAALSSIGDGSLTDKTRMQELLRVKKVLELATQRGQIGIQVDEEGREYQILPDGGGKRQVITAIDDDYKIKVIDLKGEDAVMISNRLTQEQKESLLDSLPKGTQFVIQDKKGNLKRGRK